MNGTKLALLIVGLIGAIAMTGSADARDAKELSTIFDAFNAAAKTGDTKKMLSYFTAEQHKDMGEKIKKKQERDMFVAFGRAQIPESYEIQHVQWAKDDSATLYLLAQLPAMKELERPRTRMEMAVYFKNEKGWKIDYVSALANADDIKRTKDMSYDPQNTDRDKSGEVAGRIVRTDFKADHTLVLVRVMDEEHAVFIPAKEVLLKEGMDLADLEPWKLYVFTGNPHLHDNYKFFADGGRPVEE